MLTDKKLLGVVVAVLLAVMGSLFAVQFYSLHVKLDALNAKVDSHQGDA